jgi:hypothetical protein
MRLYQGVSCIFIDYLPRKLLLAVLYWLFFLILLYNIVAEQSPLSLLLIPEFFDGLLVPLLSLAPTTSARQFLDSAVQLYDT